MFTVREAIASVGRQKALVVEQNGRHFGGASLNFVHWMHGHVPRQQLSPEQVALVEWFDKYQGSDKANETVLIG